MTILPVVPRHGFLTSGPPFLYCCMLVVKKKCPFSHISPLGRDGYIFRGPWEEDRVVLECHSREDL